MIKTNSGHVVAVSSIAGFSGETFGLAYCPTKFAVRAIMECLQMELRDRGLEGIVCSTASRYEGTLYRRTFLLHTVPARTPEAWSSHVYSR
ncbi:hypothetical protein OESDEN_11575 [Oesophagostomum dentatum]|uniref:Uncharacterized protein n=1 Tax=Oesophagostomum dentatum TaxID=61180 RepID=A0A0B1SZS8_OESDE|nr:hypothetical protein OESDEN_11575 [Oesophagostomum dentatum]